jgi:hypothetical protein
MNDEPEFRDSPRTPELPRAFTSGEFWRGAYRAWVWFAPFAFAISLVTGMILSLPGTLGFMILAALFGAPTSVAALFLGSPCAYLLGHTLRRCGRDGVHLTAFSIYGLIVGFATIAAFQAVFLPGQWAILIPYAIAAGVAVPLGWWKTSRRALADDAARILGPSLEWR